MSDSSPKPWSDNPNAPRISYLVYHAEKLNLAGILIGTIFYGIVIVLFFQCMAGLLSPANRARGGIKWGLVAHTVAMFSSVTIITAINLDVQSVSYIDNREFSDSHALPPGPVGYQFFIFYRAISIVPGVLLFLNNWLADGLLLYRCYIIYAMNHWVIAFPCLMYLASVALGITLIYQSSRPDNRLHSLTNFGLPYYPISLSLNVILTLMIVTRLILHSRNIRNAMGAPSGGNGLYKAIVTILTESCALYAVTFLLFIGPWAAHSSVQYIFLPIFSETQAIAPFLITLRVANRSALTSDTVVSGNIGSIHFKSQGKSADGTGTLHDGFPISSTGASGETPGEFGVGVETTIEEVPA